jgi:hypothetical protein
VSGKDHLQTAERQTAIAQQASTASAAMAAIPAESIQTRIQLPSLPSPILNFQFSIFHFQFHTLNCHLSFSPFCVAKITLKNKLQNLSKTLDK